MMNPLRLTRAVVAGLLLLALTASLPGREDVKKNTCKLKIKLHPEAVLEIQGKAIKGSGAERVYDSPEIEPGKEYTYTLVAKWDPNGYTTIARTYKVDVKAGQTVEVDMTRPNPKIPDDIKVIYVPTPQELVDRMCKLGSVGKDDIVYDLGCGDGRMVITAVEKFGAKKGIGIDFNPDRIKECKENAAKTKVQDKLEFRQGDIFKVADLEQATVLLLYLSDESMEQVKRILLPRLKPGTRIVSHRFLWKGEPKPKTEMVDLDGEEYLIHLWTIGDNKGQK